MSFLKEVEQTFGFTRLRKKYWDKSSQHFSGKKKTKVDIVTAFWKQNESRKRSTTVQQLVWVSCNGERDAAPPHSSSGQASRDEEEVN